MKRVIRVLLVSMLVMGLIFTAVGCGGGQSSDQTGDDQVQKIVVGTNAAFPPFESQDKGELIGFDMDLIRAIGEAQGIEVEIKHMDFKALVPAVQQGKIDAAIAGMSITPARLETVDFCDSYFDAGLIVAVRNDNESIKSKDDLKGKKLAAQTGTIGADYCQKVAKEDPSTEVRVFEDVGVAFMEMKKGGVDAVVNDHPVTLNYILTTEDAGIKMVGDIFSADDKYGIAVKKGNSDLQQLLNEGLEKIKADGTYDQLYKKWIEE
ncbi:MAG: basic amino acid ABC transporter substrate-binding protein [Syntrophomonadaceae bacterium]|nr:basic amino acid ABC transporter substrate-binding protein [Syntrophomonadaceae bacterium]MDD3888988.1 basic amino acid ABC transporter substrate-binding protein [Syntrophomonadaceae bacterium]MDD4549725.1 basic amino acid ABC transporter substrate-binding protein [Syntrophomonadaceae bacterium]